MIIMLFALRVLLRAMGGVLWLRILAFRNEAPQNTMIICIRVRSQQLEVRLVNQTFSFVPWNAGREKSLWECIPIPVHAEK